MWASMIYHFRQSHLLARIALVAFLISLPFFIFMNASWVVSNPEISTIQDIFHTHFVGDSVIPAFLLTMYCTFVRYSPEECVRVKSLQGVYTYITASTAVSASIALCTTLLTQIALWGRELPRIASTDVFFAGLRVFMMLEAVGMALFILTCLRVPLEMAVAFFITFYMLAEWIFSTWIEWIYNVIFYFVLPGSSPDFLFDAVLPFLGFMALTSLISGALWTKIERGAAS